MSKETFHDARHDGLMNRIVYRFISSRLTPLVIIASLLLGSAAVVMLPREEEPQIVVPMVDVMVEMAGASAAEVEQRVTRPLEKLLWEIPGVEYVYSISREGNSLVIVRFEVGHSASDAIVKLNAKIAANLNRIPVGVSQPLIQVKSIDDVPILALTLASERYDHATLRRVAAQMEDGVKQAAGVSETTLIGGYPRQVRVIPDRAALAARGFSLVDVVAAINQANKPLPAGKIVAADSEVLVETGAFLRSAEEVSLVVIGTYSGQPVRVGDIAQIKDGADEPDQYVFFRPGQRAASRPGFLPAVTLAIAKRKGTSAIAVAEDVLRKVATMRGHIIPADIEVTITRHYGQTAEEKSNELLLHMGIAVLSVAILLWLVLGWHEAQVVAIAIPVTLALTMASFYFLGFTLNRITLFALIFSIGILVDDPIVDVENIVRHLGMPQNRGFSVLDVTAHAVSEVRSPLILATLAVMAAILPMAFVRGLMGPYMRPIPIGASCAMFFSMVVAFIVTPWAAAKLFKHHSESEGETHREDFFTWLYRKLMGGILRHWYLRFGFLSLLALLLMAACLTVPLGLVKVKMLPFDNKSEFQVIIDMPEGTSLERTTLVAREMADLAVTLPEVENVQVYAGTASPYNFNGLVRHYYLRQGANVADVQVNLLSRHERARQSHTIAKELRPALQKIAARYGAKIKVAEVPPGPPVLQTLVAEIYGPSAEKRTELARQVEQIFKATPGVVDVDTYIEDVQKKYKFDIDREKAALFGVDTETISRNLRIAVAGMHAGILHDPREREDVNLSVRLGADERHKLPTLQLLPIRARDGNLVALGELVTIRELPSDISIHHKNLLPVSYVTGDVAGDAESPAYALLEMWQALSALKVNNGPDTGLDIHFAGQPQDENRYAMKWDGELHITYEVFRDLGLAFLAVMLLIYVLVVGWFESFKTPLIIMAAIPFSLVGILPAHWGMGVFFSATSMIGFIAGAGIVVRNSIILVDFIELLRSQGKPLREAVVEAGAVRFRPMMLTAAAVVVGASVILFDPIFQGLALSLMAGEVASLLLSRMAVPVLYYMGNRDNLTNPATNP
jgi:multidrug efflux pump subunit AcrB